jgi:hypothetical protein
MFLAQVVAVAVDITQNHPEAKVRMQHLVGQPHCLALGLPQLQLMVVAVVKMVLMFGTLQLQVHLQHTVQVVQQEQKIIPVVMLLALAQVAAVAVATTQAVQQAKGEVQVNDTQAVLLWSMARP